MSVIAGIVQSYLDKHNKVPDGKLHPSTHLSSPLRHAQLDFTGAKREPDSMVSRMRMLTGTLWHSALSTAVEEQGFAAMREVKVTQWLPEGWAGTADLLLWDSEAGGFRLYDYKTTKGEGIRWIGLKGAKQDHVLQVSAYFWAAVAAGLPVIMEPVICYLPMNDVPGEDVRIMEMAVTPIPRDVLHDQMDDRRRAVLAYARNDVALAGFPDREQRLKWNPAGSWDVTLVPHWSAMFCRFDDCGCNTQPKSEKIGSYSVEGEWKSRSGYDMIPTVEPTEKQLERGRA